MTLPLGDLGLPELPDLGAGEFSQSDLGKIILPALAGLTLGGAGGGGGGGFLRGLMHGRQMKLQRQGNATALRREFLIRASSALANVDDPTAFEETKAQLKSLAQLYGVRPEELDVYAFPESKKKVFGQQRAAGIIDRLIKLHGADTFGQLLEANASVPVDGEPVPLKTLWAQADMPTVTRTVTRPIMTEVAVPRAEEGGLSRFLQPAGTTTVQTGEEKVTEEVLPFRPTKRLTLGQRYPEIFAKPGLEYLARLPEPLDKDGNPDTMKVLTLFEKAGVRNPAQVLKEQEDNLQGQRNDVRGRMAAIRTQMNEAKTATQFSAAAQAWNTLVNNVHRYKPYLGFTELPFDVPTAVKQWRQAQASAGGAAVGEAVAVPGTAGAFEVRPIRNRQGVTTDYAINGQQFTVQQSREAARHMLLDADPGGVELALKVGVSRGQVLRWLDNEMRSLGAKTGMTGDPEASRKLAVLTRLRSQVLAGGRFAPTPESGPASTDLNQFYK